jgi:glyoxylase-like metal-dependent hydrolase (beta-lactamase superfamily II)
MKAFTGRSEHIVVAIALLFITSTATADGSRKIRIDYPLTTLAKDVYLVQGPISEPNKDNQGFRNNVVIIVTQSGVVVMDPGTSVYVGNMVLEKIRGVTDKPVVAVFNSHVHGDHWLGNQAFKNANPDVNIYAHSKMIQLAATGEGNRWIDRFNAVTDNAVVGTEPIVPNVPVTDGQTIVVGRMDFRIHATGPAHSDGDIMIEVPQKGILFTGDNVRNGTVAINIASFRGNIAAMDRALNSKADVYIPGHGKPGGRKVVLAYRDFIETLRSTVAKHYETGMEAHQIKPLVLQALNEYRHWTLFEENIGRLVSLVYLEVEEESFN